MFKLMKYELRKQLFSKILILVLLAVLEVMFLYGLFTENNNVLGLSVGLFLLTSLAAVLLVSFESIFTFSNDLKTKQSYMLFLTPNSSYKIVGAKVLSSVIYVFMTAAALVSLTLLNIGIYLMKYNDIADFVDIFREIFRVRFNVNINVALVVTLVLYFLFELVGIMVIGMASITLSSTFLSNNKGKAVVSVVFFFGINFIIGRINNLLPAASWRVPENYYYHCISSAAVMLVFYFATAWMLERKVSV